MILPWVETGWCPAPPSTLSLESLWIARQSLRDFDKSLQSQKLIQNLVFPLELA